MTNLQWLAVGSVYAALAGLAWTLFLRDYDRHRDDDKRGYRTWQGSVLEDLAPLRVLFVLFAVIWPLTGLIALAESRRRGQRG